MEESSLFLSCCFILNFIPPQVDCQEYFCFSNLLTSNIGMLKTYFTCRSPIFVFKYRVCVSEFYLSVHDRAMIFNSKGREVLIDFNFMRAHRVCSSIICFLCKYSATLLMRSGGGHFWSIFVLFSSTKLFVC